MALLEILEVPDPRLRQKSTPLDEVTDETRQLIADMFETMYEAPGIGLAAIQIGVPKRVLVIDMLDGRGLDAQPGIRRLDDRTNSHGAHVCRVAISFKVSTAI